MTGYFSRAITFATRHPRATSFVGMSALLLGYTLSADDMAMYGDAASYWSAARLFSTAQGFSLHGYVERLRGYSVPFIFYCLQQAALAIGVSPVVLFRVVSSVAGAALFAVALPTLFAHVLNARLTVRSTVVFCLLGFVYWRGHLLYSLSDLPALLLFTTGVACFRDCVAVRRWSGAMAFSSGCCIALSANARPVYQLALVAAVVLVWWYAIRIANGRAAIVPIVAFGLGVFLVLLPQSAINTHNMGSWDPFAHARSGPRQPNLYLRQLGWGVAIQRYETNIGRDDFPVAVMFLDTTGQDVLGQEDRTRDPRVGTRALDARAYLRLVAGHPLFFASAYARHLFNGLDVAYPTPYVSRIAPRSAVLALTNYLVLVVGAMYTVVLFRRVRLRTHVERLSLLAIFMLPAFATIPTAMEPRFLLPLWALVYGVFTFRFLNDNEPARLFGNWYAAPVAALGVVVCFTLASGTYMHIRGAPRAFQTWCIRQC